MSLSAGEKLGPYEILAPIGAGGMGEVYRARDRRLGRDVAIKVSAERFSERFEREARAIASLNHFNICHLYDVGPNYLVMELIDGPTLGERIKQGALPLEEALAIARQIADALETAHEKGITHRDLKPSNIKIKPDGVVKVLDFGLAKVAPAPVGDSLPEVGTTFTMGETEAGVVLGTAAYMSPEQATGKPVDQRSDIYAFGAVLYEMLTGKRLHRGETTTEVLASVIKEEPQWDKVPAQVHRLLHRCLEKDPLKRQRHIGDVMALVDDSGAEFQPADGPRSVPRRRWLWPSAVVGGLAIVAAVAYRVPWGGQPTDPSIRFEIQPTASMTFINGGYPMVSPNGKWVVLPATGTDGVTRMWLRALDSVDVRPLAGTESGNSLPPPVFWSPDSRFIAFSSTPGPFTPGQLRKLDISGGPPQTICDVVGAVIGGSWSRDGVIVFGANGAPGLFRVLAAGGVAAPVTVVNRPGGETAHRFPQFLPDGHHFLFLRVSPQPERMGIFPGSIDAKPEEQSLKPLLLMDRQVMYRPSLSGGPGQLLFLRDTTLFAQPFDPSRMELSGEPVPIADQVGSFAGATAGLFSVSETGVLAYRIGVGGDQDQLAWFDSQGKALGTLGDKAPYRNPRISPDGTRVAGTLFDRQGGNSNIWVLDLARAGASTKVTFSNGRNDYPVWSPDGKSVAFASNRNGRMDLYRKNADGSGEDVLLLKSEQDKTPTSWSHDGRFLLYSTLDPKTSDDIWVLPLQGDHKPIPFLQTEFREGQAQFSPDGHWIAYASAEAGNSEIYIRPFSPEKEPDATAGGKWMISKGGGIDPLWRGDGRELFYYSISLKQMAVDIDAGKTFRAGVPRPLFSIGGLYSGDVMADGKRFLVVSAPEGASAPSPFMVVTNWQTALKK